MGKIKLDAHASVVVAHCIESGKLVFNVYDDGYPVTAYRGSANNIGGNPEAGDKDPENVLIREACEEFDPNHAEEKQHVGKVVWASEQDIRIIRNGLLARLEPMQDFLATQQGIIEGGNKPYTAIYSAFYTAVSPEVIELVEKNIRDGRNIPTEGLVGVFTLEQLANHKRGEFSTAHLTAQILNWKFQTGIPSPKQLVSEPIGLPRRAFSYYLPDFEYSNEGLRKATEARD